MKLKIDAEGHAVIQDGKPVYVHDDGKEVPFDAQAAIAKIGQLNGEAMGHRQAKEAAEAALKRFEGISDPNAALDALSKLANIDAKKLIDSGQVDTIKAEAIKAVEEKYAPVLAERDTLKSQLDKEIRGGSFARSKFAEEKVVVPRHMLERTYGDNFKVEDGKLVPYDSNGAKIFSRVKPGEIAEFDEALELLISADPYRDHILKGQIGAGGGSTSSVQGQGGPKSMARGDFMKLAPAEQAAKAKDGFTITD